MRVRLPYGAKAKPKVDWFTEFKCFGIRESCFIAPNDWSQEPVHRDGYIIYSTFINRASDAKYLNKHLVQLSPGVKNVLSGKAWLDKHWADLEDYHPTVELYFGNGYKQTFTLKKPELMKQIIKINTGKRYFRQLVERS